MDVLKKVRFLNHFHELHFIYIIAQRVLEWCMSFFESVSLINVDDSFVYSPKSNVSG